MKSEDERIDSLKIVAEGGAVSMTVAEDTDNGGTIKREIQALLMEARKEPSTDQKLATLLKEYFDTKRLLRESTAKMYEDCESSGDCYSQDETGRDTWCYFCNEYHSKHKTIRNRYGYLMRKMKGFYE